MVHIVQLKVRKQKLFGKAKNGSIWMHNHQAWTAEQLKRVQALATSRADMNEAYDLQHASEARKNRERKLFFATGDDGTQRYIDIDRKHWTKVRGAS
jgi:hypothetical protein